MFRISFLCAIVFAQMVRIPCAVAQTGTAAEVGGVRIHVLGAASAAHVPLRWSGLTQRIINTRDEPLEALCVTLFPSQPGLQYGRRIVVPPHAMLKTWQPLRLPDAPPPDRRNPQIREMEFRTLIFDSMRPDVQPLPLEAGRKELRETIWLMHPGQVIGLVAPPTEPVEDAAGIDLFDFVMTGRVGQAIKHNFIVLNEGLPPGGEASLDGFDQLVVADDRILGDFSAMTALRRWLFGGGRLWVMLDQVDVSLLETLLGDEFAAHVVDRVGLTEVWLRAGAASPPGDEQPRQFDRPVDLVRLLPGGLDVAYAADGWPAACWKTCGQGRLLITTLGADAWVRPRAASDGPPLWGGDRDTGYVSQPAFDQLMSQFLVPRSEPLLKPEVLESHAREYVGYTIPSKGIVVGILSAFAIFLAGVGTWLLRNGSAERLGVFAPVAALLTSLSLMAIGREHRSLPEMTAVTQFVRPIPGTDDMRLSGAAATFVADAGPVAFSGHRGWLMPSDARQPTGVARIVWSGLDHWNWENLRLTQGVHGAQFQTADLVGTRTRAEAAFDDEGVSGRLTLPPPFTATDAMLVTPQGRLEVEIDERGEFRAPAEGVLSAGEYLSDGILTDEQARRGRVLQALVESSGDRFPLQPMLVFWTRPWELGLSYPSESPLAGGALVTVPIRLERPPVGTLITIPSPFMTYREKSVSGLEFLSGAYDHRTGAWIERTTPTTTWLGFDVPPGLAPVQPTQALLTIRVRGAMGRLEVAAVKDGEPQSIETWDDPVGTLRLEIDDPSLLQLAADGTLMLRISFGKPQSPPAGERFVLRDASAFQIESLSLQLQATVLEAGGGSTTVN